MRVTGPTFAAILLFSATLSGCISFEGENSSNSDNQDNNGDDIYSIHCQEYDDLERCWKLLVPDSVEKDTLVPLVVDIHGYTQDMDKHNNVTGFADLALSLIHI